MAMLGQKLTLSKNDWIFERYNPKYNRLWEQMTEIGLLTIQVVVGYIFALMAIESLSGTVFALSFFFITLVLFILTILIGRLELERLKTRNFLNNYLSS